MLSQESNGECDREGERGEGKEGHNAEKSVTNMHGKLMLPKIYREIELLTLFFASFTTLPFALYLVAKKIHNAMFMFIYFYT